MTWPRTSVGTLQCPCGRPGQLFPCIGTDLNDELEVVGVFAGYCSESCYGAGRAAGHPEPNPVNEPIEGFFS